MYKLTLQNMDKLKLIEKIQGKKSEFREVLEIDPTLRKYKEEAKSMANMLIRFCDEIIDMILEEKD